MRSRKRRGELRPAEFFRDWPAAVPAARTELVERLRPEAVRMAYGVGAETDDEVRAACEAVGLACLAEAGWRVLLLRPPESM